MSRFDFFMEKLLEDGFTRDEIEFLCINEVAVSQEDLSDYMEFGEAYSDFKYKMKNKIHSNHLDCAMY